jgi:uncharacterized Tic20 family protein
MKLQGDFMKRRPHCLELSPEEIIDTTNEENIKILKKINLSSLAFVFFPVLGIILPLIIWSSKKKSILFYKDSIKILINFQITWTLLLFFVCSILLWFINFSLRDGFIDAYLIGNIKILLFFVIVILYSYNLFLIMLNKNRLNKKKLLCYIPTISFLK